MPGAILWEYFPSLAILDIEMPARKTYHTVIGLRRIRSSFRVPPTPVVLFSTHETVRNEVH
jgi:CheY-like chemotaxis protein